MPCTVGVRAGGRPWAHRRPSLTVTQWPVSSESVPVATRKMVNYAPRRVKPEETLVEARSVSDVQTDRCTWV